jgi:hypothetical protein
MRLLLRYGLIRAASPLGRLTDFLPRRWFYVVNARVGLDCETYVTVHLKRKAWP